MSIRTREMANNSDEIDHQLAADIETHTINQLKQHLVPQLQKERDTIDEAMAAAWQTIQSSMDEFDHKKRVMFATLKEVQGLERAKRVFDNELDDLKLKTFEEIAQAVRRAQPSPKADNLPSPLISPKAGRYEDIDQRSATYDTDHPALPAYSITPVRPSHDNRQPEPSSSTAEVVAVRSPGKRKINTLENRTPQSSKKKARRSNIPHQNLEEFSLLKLKNDPLGSWEVEGEDYVFQYPRAGPGWFVIQCNIGDRSYIAPVRFTEHPFQNGYAMSHFNDKGHSCHDTSRNYEPDDIIREFGFRVEKAQGEKELDEEWATNSNERIFRDAAKTAAKGAGKAIKGKGKGKEKQPELAPTNRTTLSGSRVPRTDMGPSGNEGN